ncbi:MAG: hypothetical protein KAI24_19895 [Planctomycetes bacterium]|nr:hypothetical protein [Planctomycetota bacterium]
MNHSTVQAGVLGGLYVLQRPAAGSPAALRPRSDDAPTKPALEQARPRTLAEVDLATISEAARNLRAAERRQDARDAAPDPTAPPGEQDLSDSQRAAVRELEARDREVRAHERAHQAAAGDLAVGGPTYTYQTGPDGERYAIGGAVDIRLQTSGSPEQTQRDLERAQRAASAPASPSGPDRAVAARAAAMATRARWQQAAAAQPRAPGGHVDLLT